MSSNQVASPRAQGRHSYLLWAGWLGACLIGGLLGGQLAAARTSSPVFFTLFALGGFWALLCRGILRRRGDHITAWVVERLLCSAPAMPFMAAFAGLLISALVEPGAPALLWAAGMGAMLGLGSGLQVNAFVSPPARRRWLTTTAVCGALTLTLAVALAHPLPSLIPDQRSALLVGLMVGAGWGLLPGALLGPLLATMPQAMAETVQRRLDRAASPRRRRLRRALIALSLIAIAASAYVQRCAFISCPPISWAELLDLARAQAAGAGTSYRVGRIHARPAYRSELDSDGPRDITISIDLVSTEPERRSLEMYPSRTIEIDDRDPRIRGLAEGSTSELPSPEDLARLGRVRIGPREVFRLTWQVARAELAASIDRSDTWMSLETDGALLARHGLAAESAWAITYRDDVSRLTYLVDAQTGAIISQIRDP